MVINTIHLGPVVFAKTLAASIATRQTAPCAANDSGVHHGAWRIVGRQGAGSRNQRDDRPPRMKVNNR